MSFLKGRMTALGIVAAVLALIGVQAVAFSQTGQTPDAFKPAPAAASTTPEAELSSEAAEPSDAPTTEDLQSQDSNTPAAMPSITGSSLDDDDESGDDSEGEELESGDDD